MKKFIKIAIETPIVRAYDNVDLNKALQGGQIIIIEPSQQQTPYEDDEKCYY